MLQHRNYWFGKECEGRYTGIPTLFISNLDADAAWDRHTNKMPHIYICSVALESASEVDLHDLWNRLFELITKENKVVTLEVTPEMLAFHRIPPMMLIHCHILLMIESTGIQKLKSTDSVKIVYNDYSLYCATIDNMQHVTPKDYANDTNI